MHQCRKLKFWHHWLVSAGQADRCTRGSALTYLSSMSLYDVVVQVCILYFYHKNKEAQNNYLAILSPRLLMKTMAVKQVNVEMRTILERSYSFGRNYQPDSRHWGFYPGAKLPLPSTQYHRKFYLYRVIGLKLYFFRM